MIIVISHNDINGKLMANELKDLALRMQSIIETAIDGIITISSTGVVETMNLAACNLFGYHKEEVISNNIKTLMPEPYHSEHDGYLNRYLTTRQAKIIGIGREVIGKRKDGTLFPFRLAVAEVLLNDRIIFTGIIHDLSEVKKVEEKLIQQNEELEDKVIQRTDELEKVVNRLLKTNKALEGSQMLLENSLVKEKELNELKSRFVSMASHEFRTPLSTILSSASLIGKYKENEQNDKREKHVNRIKSAVSNLTGILNDFLSLSKLEEGKVILKLEPFNLNELCDLVIDELKGFKKAGQKIIHTTNQVDFTMTSDVRILKNILFNLMSNAIKYSPEDSEIRCINSVENQKIYFSIEDDGIGIPEAEQKYLFERFFRASNVETIQGTGLGLNIVQRYIKLLDGEITVESQEGKGTSFRFSIPKNNFEEQ